MKSVILSLVFFSVFGAPSHSWTKPSPTKKSGTYSFQSSSGKPYIGKSVDLNRRLKQHERTGKLNPKDRNTVKMAPNVLSKKGNGIIEKTRIRAADIYTNGGLANKQHAPHSRKANK